MALAMLKLGLALLLFLLGGLGAAAQAPPELVVEAPASLEAAAKRVRAVQPWKVAEVARLVGLEEPGPPIRVRIAPEGSELARAVAPWISGYAWSETGAVVLLPSRVPNYPASSLEDLLLHEVAHVLISRASDHQPLPRWFHEGLALVAGQEWGLEDRSRLSLALVTGGEMTLDELDRQFSGGQGQVHRAYSVAGAFVHDLLGRYGQDAPAEILDGVRRGQPFAGAFLLATGASLAEAESSFWRRQTFWYRWVPFLTSSAVLWILVTLLALWAIRRRRARDAALRQQWEEEDLRASAALPEEPVN